MRESWRAEQKGNGGVGEPLLPLLMWPPEERAEREKERGRRAVGWGVAPPAELQCRPVAQARFGGAVTVTEATAIDGARTGAAVSGGDWPERGGERKGRLTRLDPDLHSGLVKFDTFPCSKLDTNFCVCSVKRVLQLCFWVHQLNSL